MSKCMQPMKARIFKLNAVSALITVITAFTIASLAAKEKPAASDSVFATGMQEGGRLVIKRAPSLGNRLIVGLKIDGAKP